MNGRIIAEWLSEASIGDGETVQPRCLFLSGIPFAAF